jgi:hypothetical protein
VRASTLAAGLGAALPTVASTAGAVAAGVVPAGDRAVIALRAYEVFSSHTPLVGEYSASSVVAGRAVYSPGPLLYWLLAFPARFGSPASLSVLVGVLNVLAIVGSVALARRRGGVPLMLACAFAVVLVSRSWAPETLHDIWNASAPLMPFTLLLFLCWSLACGEYKLLPLTALTASFAIQSELTFLAPTLAVTAIGVAGLLLSRARPEAQRDPGANRQPSGGVASLQPRIGRVWPWVLAGLLVVAVCWSGPVIDELEHSPGNLTSIVAAAEAHEPKQGPVVGWHAVVRAVGIPPWWLTAPSAPFTRFQEVRTAPGALAVLSTVVLLAGLCALLLAGLLRGRLDLAAGAGIGLALALALFAVAGATPAGVDVSHSLGYTMWWGSQAGMWVWLMLLYGVSLLGGRLAARVIPRLRATTVAGRAAAGSGGAPARLSLSGVRLAAAPALAGMILLVATGAVVAGAQGPDQDQRKYHPIATIDARLIAALGPSVHTVLLLGSPDSAAFDIRTAAGFALRRHGLRVLDPAAAIRLNASYARNTSGYQAVLCVSDERGRATGQVLGRFNRPALPMILITLNIASSPPAQHVPSASICRR